MKQVFERDRIGLVRLPVVALADITAHMADPRMAVHMPLLGSSWNDQDSRQFVQAKEACWNRDGLGHWGILYEDIYAGWGGFQKEGDEWDFGLVLRPEFFGLGNAVIHLALDFARHDPRIDAITFLIPPSRQKRGIFARLGAEFVGMIDYDGRDFLKYRLVIG